jgi:Mn2+/Fe2+ NRAMP family transporter
MRRRRAALLLAVLGPGLLAGLSDDDPPGITTYSILGAEHGYQLLWVLALATAALIVFHELGARLGAVTGQGLIGLVRERFGVRVAAAALVCLLVANLGTMCAELAGVAAALDPAGVRRWIAVPLAAVTVSALVLKGSFRRVEHILLALASVFAAYIVSGILAQPDWGAAAHGLLVPSLSGGRDAVLLAVATVGTTLAPWGLAFIQSYVVDKRLGPDDLAAERIDVVCGALMTGIIGFFVVVACAATLHRSGRTIQDAGDAAAALEPVAGHLAQLLFSAGLLGAALLAASVLPLATAYSVGEALGVETALDDRIRDAPVFYGTFGFVVAAACVVVLVPGMPLVPLLYLSQALNAVLLLPLLWLMRIVGRDPYLMGRHRLGRAGAMATLAAVALLAVCVAALAALELA